jgi:3,4-dihydroxy 2-butanone 4-phosphate synthase/GTP cyclohydrolase II
MISSIPSALEDIRRGAMFVLVDDPSRENEGDLCVAAEHVTPDKVNLMLREARGMLCLALDGETCDRLQLLPQVANNTSRLTTAFTVTVDARDGITTGISAQDRSQTIQVAVRDGARPEDLVRPGHVSPLRARDGGVLVRTGHTEGVTDLCRLAGLKPAGVICEILKDDGSMARLPDLMEFVRKHRLHILTIADLIEYRRRRERIIERISSVRMPTGVGPFQLHSYRSTIDGRVHVALCVGIEAPAEIGGRFPPIEEPVVVRVHSECLTGDVFGSERCDCGPQLRTAMERVQKEGRGVILYIRQEGRGIGLEHKLRAYALQDQGMDTVEANLHLGFRADEREYGTGAQILHDLGLRRLRLLTNNPKKLSGLSGYGLEIVEQLPLQVPPGAHNERYLRTKKEKLGHHLDIAPPRDQPLGSGRAGTTGSGGEPRAPQGTS